ncbi:MAG: nuclear transport factor 2 family protein [Betaproteobacteria bacterium]|nr:nuclear transport factor 2 family protein [Betaproteobacteria bacterium]
MARRPKHPFNCFAASWWHPRRLVCHGVVAWTSTGGTGVHSLPTYRDTTMNDPRLYSLPRHLPFDDWFAIQQLHAAYALAVDGMDFEAMGRLFTDDIVLDLDLAAPELPARGRAAAVNALRSRREGAALMGGALRRHVISNLLILAATSNRIDACVVMQLIETRPEGVRILQTSVYTDVFRRGQGPAGPWLFAERRLKRDVAGSR